MVRDAAFALYGKGGQLEVDLVHEDKAVPEIST
jgi:hypothetical protein